MMTMQPWHKFAIIAGLFLILTGAFPKKTSYDPAWSRTAMTVPEPRGRGCITSNATTAAAAALVRNGYGTRAVYQLPLQVVVTNTATSAITLCASQNPATSVDRTGLFPASGVYSLGAGICRVFAAGATDYFGVPSDAYSGVAGGFPVGTVPALGLNTYLLAINPAGTGSSDVIVCEVE
jgi:hypothetical protein